MDVLVVGAGSLGSLVGGLLAREHDVTLVGREPHVRAIREEGLAIDGEIRDRVHLAATADLDGAAADLAVVTVKTYDTERAAATIAGCDVGAVWSLQNGLDNEATLARALCEGDREVPVLAGTATYGADLTAPGTVTCTGIGEAVIGPRPGTDTPESDAALSERLARELDASAASGSGGQSRGGQGDDAAGGLAVVFDEAMPRRLWRKLAVNAGINPVTALARVENGALADGPTGPLARAAARETARVATASGIDLAEDEAVAAFDAVLEATADNRSSMLQDVAAGRRTETDAISGAIADRAEEHGVSAPTNRTLAAILRQWERGRGLR